MSEFVKFPVGRFVVSLVFSWGWFLFGGSLKRRDNALQAKREQGYVFAHQYLLQVGVVPFLRVEIVWIGGVKRLDRKQARRRKRAARRRR